MCVSYYVNYSSRSLRLVLINKFSNGMSTNYFVLSDPGTKKNLVIRMADPALHVPQSVAIYNPIAVSAFVQTDHKTNMNEDAFLLLLKMIKYDFDQYMNSSQTWYPYPKYLLR